MKRKTTVTLRVFGKDNELLVQAVCSTTAQRCSAIGAWVQKKLESLALPFIDAATHGTVEGFMDSTFDLRPVNVKVTYKGQVVEERREAASYCRPVQSA